MHDSEGVVQTRRIRGEASWDPAFDDETFSETWNELVTKQSCAVTSCRYALTDNCVLAVLANHKKFSVFILDCLPAKNKLECYFELKMILSRNNIQSKYPRLMFLGWSLNQNIEELSKKEHSTKRLKWRLLTKAGHDKARNAPFDVAPT